MLENMWEMLEVLPDKHVKLATHKFSLVICGAGSKARGGTGAVCSAGEPMPNWGAARRARQGDSP